MVDVTRYEKVDVTRYEIVDVTRYEMVDVTRYEIVDFTISDLTAICPTILILGIYPKLHRFYGIKVKNFCNTSTYPLVMGL